MIPVNPSPNLDQVLDRLNGLLPRLDVTEQQVAIRLYRRLAEGIPVAVERIGSDLHMSPEEVERILDRWYGVFRDDERRVTGFWGLSLQETRHRFRVDGRLLYTWCAWDALFIPEILAKSAHVESNCPVTGGRIRLVVTPQGIEQVDPSDPVMSLLIPEQARVRDNVLRHFCHHVHFFRSVEAGSFWAAENGGTFLISLDDAYALGRKKNADRFGGVRARRAAEGGGQDG